MTETAASTVASADQDALFASNMAAFERWAPKQHASLVRMQHTDTLVVRTGDGKVNLDLGHTTLYEPDAETFSREQVDAFVARPGRFTFDPPPYPEPLQYVNQRVVRAVYDHFGKANIRTLKYAPQEHNGFLITFGLGLGLHLPQLFERIHFRNLIIIEQHWEFVYHSLRQIDWTPLFETFEARGGEIHFFISDDPEGLAAVLYRSLRGSQFALIDGAYLFRHYSSFVLDGAYKRFLEQLPTVPYSKGYYEDELVMMTNCLGNLLRHDFGLMEDRPRVEKPLPAFVVGSGPSVDASIEVIRGFRVKVVLFSGGTGLRVLLKAGIRPDFHCEIENGAAVFEALSLVREQFDFSGITLIGSTTLDPRVPALFDHRIFYFRDGLSSTELFGGKFGEVGGSGPTVTNLGARSALAFGFTEIYLFGVDMGARDPAHHHSKETIYSINEKWKKYLSAAGEPMGRPVPGNFGGTVYTNGLLLWSKFHMSTVFEAFPNRTIYNCSDGAKIGGTQPKLPKRVRIDTTPEQRANALRRMANEISYHKARDLLTREQIAEAGACFAAWYDKMIDVTRSSRDDGSTFLTFYDRVLPMLVGKPVRGAEQAVWVMNVGTVTMMLQVGYYFFRRVDEDKRAELMKVYLDEFTNTLLDLRSGASDLLDRFVRQYDETRAA